MNEPSPRHPPAEEMFAQLYDELRMVARRYMGGERVNHTLQPTALVNEAFLRLAETSPMNIENRVHFLRLAARTMRRILVDYARKKGAARHGGFMTRVTLTDQITGTTPEFDLLALDEALDKLDKLSTRQATIIEMRYIVGLNVDEVATELSVSERTVKGDTRVAMAWLRRELS